MYYSSSEILSLTHMGGSSPSSLSPGKGNAESRPLGFVYSLLGKHRCAYCTENIHKPLKEPAPVFRQKYCRERRLQAKTARTFAPPPPLRAGPPRRGPGSAGRVDGGPLPPSGAGGERRRRSGAPLSAAARKGGRRL